MKNMKKFAHIMLAASLSLGLLATAGCGGGGSSSGNTPSGSQGGQTPAGEKTVESIEVSKLPAQVDYFVGDEFSPEGGEITITYSDGSTETRKLTDEGVDVSNVNTSINDEKEDSESKTVTVKYGGKNARFEVTVSYEMVDVLFNLGYEGAENETVQIRKNSYVDRPEDPVREEFQFDNWYADEALTATFNFDAEIAQDTTVYAKWLENAVYYNVSFSANFADAPEGETQKVKSGDAAVRPSTDPERTGYTFDGWYADAEGTTAYTFEEAVEADTTVYAKWVKASQGKQWYVFEAEDTNLDGRSGPGLSGTAGGPGMIQLTTELGASNDRFVGYQYEIGCNLTFQFNSDMDTDDATIVIRLSGELRDFDIDPTTYSIDLNAKPVKYSKIVFKDVPKGSSDDVDGIHALPFEDYVLVENAHLKEGLNSISLTTMNDEGMDGTTMLSKAPLVDCIKIETEAVLDWASQLGLPKKNY
ncbi:MAG: InlB B-repeat-containing protein [Lachnospiraceae bacterium]|nr:InlB B-repeat-containing protein [Lachnospiraceae bacterium]